jgi:cytosine permease
MSFDRRWHHLSAVQIGGAICLPTFVIGHAVAMKYGIFSALLATLIGNGILLGLGCVSALFSAKTRMTTAETAADAFDKIGQSLFSVALTFAMIGWFAIQLNLMAMAVGSFLGFSSTLGLNFLLGCAMTMVSLKGIKGIETLANFCIPLMVITIGYATWEASKMPLVLPFDKELSFGGISLIFAASIGAVIDMPTFFRHAKTPLDGIAAAVVLFGLILPILEGVGIFLAAHGGGENIIDSLLPENGSFAWNAWVSLFLLMAGWTTNNANLYSAGISLKAILSKGSENFCLIFCGIAGTMLSFLNLEQHLLLLLEIVGIVLAAAGGTMVIHQMTFRKMKLSWKGVSFVLGILSGFFSLMGYGLSGLVVLDAFAVSFICITTETLFKIVRNNN